MRHQKEINQLISENRFESAEKLIIKALVKVDRSETLDLLRLLVSVSEKNGSASKLKSQRYKLVELLYENNEWNEVIEQIRFILGSPKVFEQLKYLKVAMNGLPLKRILFLYWKCLIDVGELEEADQIGAWYVQLIFEGKHIDSFKEFMDLEKKFGRKNIQVFERVLYYIYLGDQEKLEEEIRQNLSLDMAIVEHIYHKIIFPNKFIAEYLLESYLSLIEANIRKIRVCRSHKKSFMNIAYQYLIRFPEATKGLITISRYAKIFEAASLQQSLLRRVEALKGEQFEAVCAVVKENSSASNCEIKNGLDSEEVYDLGTDLFETQDISDDRVRLLERDINYLINNGSLDKAEELARQLEIIDSENTVLLDFTNAMKNLDGKPKRKNIDDVEKKLRTLLSQYVKRGDEPFNLERTIGKNIEYLDINFLKENYMDILNGFIAMNCNDAASVLIDRVENEGLVGNVLKEKLKFEYLRIMNLIELAMLHEALACADEIVRIWPVSRDEKVTFMYMIVEIYILQEKKNLALGVAKAILALVPNHAKASLRVTELE